MFRRTLTNAILGVVVLPVWSRAQQPDTSRLAPVVVTATRVPIALATSDCAA